MGDEPENPFKGTPWEGLFGQFAGGQPGQPDQSGQSGPGAPGDPSGQAPDFNAMFAQIQQLMQPNPDGKAVNWQLATDIARKQVAASTDRSMTRADTSSVADSVRLAEHWLTDTSTLPAAAVSGAAWSRAEWVEQTMPTWQQVIEPVAEHVAGALGRSLPGETAQLAGPMTAMIRQLGGSVFGAQVGQAIGELATEVVSGTEIGLPLGTPGEAVLLPQNLEAFAAGLDVDLDDVRLYLALREVARQRLFVSVGWLSEHLFGLVGEYAAGISVDTSRLEDAMGDPSALSDPESMQRAIGDGLFEPVQSTEQQAVLARLETTLALVEGWVDDVVRQATEHRMPAAGQLAEMVRRRRAAGGPAEQTFASLVGLELRPRRLRDAANLWAAVRDARGIEGRDALWEYADLLPGAAALDDPVGFARDLEAVDELDMSELDDLRDAGGYPADGDTGDTGNTGDTDDTGEGKPPT